MALAVQPSGLMDIASSLTQVEIPFKLRCAICNKLALNAFRLPCCDQAICENCQTALPDTCPVCAHTPISSELCKPNKALRTTLKAFLRTEEKKREKELQAALPATTDEATPAEETPVKPDSQQQSLGTEEKPTDGIALPNPSEDLAEAQPPDVTPSVGAEANAPNVEHGGTNGIPQDGHPEHDPSKTTDQAREPELNRPAAGDHGETTKLVQETEQNAPQNAGPGAGFSNTMGFNMDSGMFPSMAWGANPMAQFMSNGMMMGLPNAMGMPRMGMDPMAASQGMFGGYGMNLSGMSNGMNMGMNFNAGQGMYGGWDGSQDNMWNGSQDKFNPNAFANGMGAQFGDPSGFGGYNMSQPNGIYAQMQQQQFPHQEFQNGYYGPGNYRGRGRGFYPGGRGRGGYAGHMQPNFPHNANYSAVEPSAIKQDNSSSSMNPDMPSQQEGAADGIALGDTTSTTEGKNGDDGTNPADEPDPSSKEPSTKEAIDKPEGDSLESTPAVAGPLNQATSKENQQLHGIPTIDSLNQANSPHGFPNGPMGVPGYMNQGFSRGAGGYMRGGFPGGRGGSFGGQQFMPGANMQPRGQGVEGAPAAPRAMREGLPNTSVFRQRNFQAPGRGSIPPGRGSETSQTPYSEPVQKDELPQSTSRSMSRARSRSRSRSKFRSPTRSRSNSHRRYRQHSPSVENNANGYDRQRPRHRTSHPVEKERPATEDERRTRSPSLESHRSSRHRDIGRDRRSTRRSHRSHRRRSRSRSASLNHQGNDDRLSSIVEESSSSKSQRRNLESLETSNHTHRSGKDRSSRREEDRERDRDPRRRERDRDRHRERERDRHRERDRDRERDRKRSRRDRSESAVDSDYHSRKNKRGREDNMRNSNSDRDRARETREPKPSDPEKDPHTLEREARNRERLLKEQQRREAMQSDTRDSGKSSRRRDSRQERTGRRLNYKYDDEADAARAARVEREREVSRWA